MNIIYDLRPLQSASGGRGIGVYTRKLIETISKIDRENHYCLVYYGNKKKPSLELDEGFSYKFHSLSSLPPRLSRFNFFYDLLFLKGQLKKLNPDIIHFPSPMEMDSHYDVQELNKISVVTFHDMIPYVYRDKVFTGKRKLLLPLYKNLLWSLEKVSRIIFVSEYSRQDVLNLLNIDKEKTEAIHSGFGEGKVETGGREFEQNKETAQDSPGFHSGDQEGTKAPVSKTTSRVSQPLPLNLQPGQYVIFVGDVSPYKNPDVVVRALPIVRKKYGINVHFVIVGKTNPPDRERIEKLANEKECSSLLHFTGYVSKEDLENLYGNARCVVFPSKYEGFGFPALEAMKAGVPLIAADATAIPEVVGDGGILLPPDDEEKWADGIAKIFKNRDFTEELINKGKERLKQFPWEKAARETLEVYKKINSDI